MQHVQAGECLAPVGTSVMFNAKLAKHVQVSGLLRRF
jgi:hypothetical protein